MLIAALEASIYCLCWPEKDPLLMKMRVISSFLLACSNVASSVNMCVVNLCQLKSILTQGQPLRLTSIEIEKAMIYPST